MKYYYADAQNRTAGPITLEELLGLIKDGRLKTDPMVVVQGGADWKPLSTIYTKATAAPAGSNQATQMTEQAKAASEDALEAFRIISTNPVGGLSAAFEKLGGERAMRAGFAFGVVSMLSGCLLIYHVMGYSGDSITIDDFLKMLLVAMTPFLSLFAVCIGIKRVFKGEGVLGHDAFVAGSVQLPMSVLFLAAALLGFEKFENVEILVLIGLFAVCLTVMMLFAGFTQLCKLKEQPATFAVPLAVLANVWLTKMVLTSLLKLS